MSDDELPCLRCPLKVGDTVSIQLASDGRPRHDEDTDRTTYPGIRAGEWVNVMVESIGLDGRVRVVGFPHDKGSWWHYPADTVGDHIRPAIPAPDVLEMAPTDEKPTPDDERLLSVFGREMLGVFHGHQEVTLRRVARVEFTDRYGAECSVQKSSLATEDAIWVGVNEPEPQIMAREAHAMGREDLLLPEGDPERLNGWVPYPLPAGVLCNTRMHLTREQASRLSVLLAHFAGTGDLPVAQEETQKLPAEREYLGRVLALMDDIESEVNDRLQDFSNDLVMRRAIDAIEECVFRARTMLKVTLSLLGEERFSVEGGVTSGGEDAEGLTSSDERLLNVLGRELLSVRHDPQEVIARRVARVAHDLVREGDWALDPRGRELVRLTEGEAAAARRGEYAGWRFERVLSEEAE